MRGSYKIITGDIRSKYRDVGKVNCIITSPPYYQLRDCGEKKQIGLESSVNEYVLELVKTFHNLKENLSDEGTFFLNLGDKYVSGVLQGVPWRVVIALCEDGWVLKNDIIWNRNRIMPESVKNRFTKSHEYVFFFAKKNSGYTFNHSEVREPAKWAKDRRAGKGRHIYSEARGNSSHTAAVSIAADGKKSKRTVWTIETSQGKYHHSTFPEKLVEVCVLAGSNVGDVVLDPFSGSGTTGVVAVVNGRGFIGVDVKAEYSRLARSRIKKSIGR